MAITEIAADIIRAHFAGISLPAEMSLGPGVHITDLPRFVDTQIERLESGPPMLRRLAFGALATIAEKLGHPFPIG